MVTLSERQLKEFLEERNLNHLYTEERETLIKNLKDSNIITGVIYEPKFSISNFDGVNKLSSYRILYVINTEGKNEK